MMFGIVGISFGRIAHFTSVCPFYTPWQAVSVLVFTAEILMRLFIAPISSKYAFSRWNYITSFYGIIDLASILPW